MKISKELAKGSTGLLVLSVLSNGELYGYQIIKTVELMSENVFQMNEGTLYPILHSLEKEGFLTSRWCESEENSRKRKYYKITDKGRKELAAQKAEWESYSRAVDKVVGRAISAT
ncbi:MAG: PadR family transcriptional regulator [Oscillospiraceae bacterium]|nr:PadR family transcriptional regulator [Oscillospiraceae bacterium]